MTDQEELVSLLKQKGTGKTMSKSLRTNQLSDLTNLLQSDHAALATKATILTAFLMLPNTEEETIWFEQFKKKLHTQCPAELHFLFKPAKDNQRFIHLIHRVIEEKDCNKSDMTFALEQIFDNTVPNYLKTAFLEAERLKEESFIENKTTLDFCYQQSKHVKVDTPLLIDIANPYDGFNRFQNISLLLPAFLAALGFATVCHGCKEVSPKKGINMHKCLEASGKNPLKSPQDVISSIENEKIGWAYIDQTQFFPELHHYVTLRQELVKRPVLTTIEKFMQPVISTRKNIIITGYTHPPYRQKSIDLLDTLSDCDAYALFRGTEGSSQLSLDRRSPAIFKTTQAKKETFIRPSDYGLQEIERIQPNLQLTVQETVQFNKQALQNKESIAFKLIAYNAMAILNELNLFELAHLKQKINHEDFLIKFNSHWNHY